MPVDEDFDDDLTMGRFEPFPPQMPYRPNYIVYLESTGGNRIATMKVLRELGHHVVLEDSKYIVYHLPYKIGDNVIAEIAHRAKDEFEKVGAQVKLVPIGE